MSQLHPQGETLPDTTIRSGTMYGPTSFMLVSYMNVAFGNPKGHADRIDWDRIAKQSLNIADELAEVFIAMGADEEQAKFAASDFKHTLTKLYNFGQAQGRKPVLDKVRDGLVDVNVFSYGAHHLMGIDADRDMRSVIEGVMTRFVKDDEDLYKTVAKHAAKGVTEIYTEGEYPTMIVKSAVDQPDAPKGKFLKSASYSEPVFYKVG